MDIPKWLKRISFQDSDDAYKKFYENLKNRKFTTTKCKSCEKSFFPPKVICPHCFSPDLEWIELSGRGRIYAFSQHDRSLLFGPPDVIGLVELKEGIGRVFTKIEGKMEDLKIGQEVKIEYQDISPDFTLHKFVPI